MIKMKNFNIFEGGGGDLPRKTEVVFLRGVDTPMHTMLVLW